MKKALYPILLVASAVACSQLPVQPDMTQKTAEAPASEAEMLRRGKSNAAIAQRNSEASAEYHFSMAQAYVAEGNSDRAIEEYKLALLFDPTSPVVHARLATEYVKKGMIAAAMETCKEALQHDPNYTDARLLLAGLYSSTRENPKALSEYDLILKKDPLHEEATFFKSQVLIEDGHGKQAVALLQKFTRQSSESVSGWFYLGRAAQSQEQWPLAVSAFKKALELKPSFTQAGLSLGFLYEEKGELEKAIATYRQIYEDQQDLAAANRLATLYLKAEKYSSAVPFLEALRASDPDDLNVRVKLGLVQMEMKKYDQAIVTFQQILKKSPESDRIHYYLGSIFEELKRTDEAIVELSSIDGGSRLFTDAALHVGYLYQQSGRADQAKKFMQSAIVKSPKFAGFHLFLATLEEESKNVSGAIAVLDKAVIGFPEDEKIRYYLGSLLDRQGETDKSLAQMEEILKLNPNHVDALNYVGYTWTLQGVRFSDAEKALKKAMKLKPGNGYITDSWGWFLFVTGKLREAVVALEKAVKFKPDEATILEHLGDAYLKAELPEKALYQYAEAVRHSVEDAPKIKVIAKFESLKSEMMRAGRKLPAHLDGTGGRMPAAHPSSPASP